MAAEEIVPTQTFSPEQAARRAKAEERAERIRSHLAAAAEDYVAAVIEEDRRALGFGSIEVWRAAMFAGQRLAVETRRQVAELLSEHGIEPWISPKLRLVRQQILYVSCGD
jgi:hypothetical protein